MKSTVQCRDAKAAHAKIYARHQNDYASKENRRGQIEFFHPPQAFANGSHNRIAVFDPGRRTLTFTPAVSRMIPCTEDELNRAVDRLFTTEGREV